MSMFISSGNIKVYPTAFRDNASGDTNSCLMSEKNITNLKKVSSINNFNNYVNFIEGSGDFTVDLTLSGYKFIFNFSNVSSLSHTSGRDDLYAGIKIVNDELYPNTGTANRILDENGAFKGLTITDNVSDFDNNFIYIKIGYWNSSNSVWSPFTTNNNLKLLASEVSYDNLGAKNITEQFDTGTLNVSDDATIGDDVSVGGDINLTGDIIKGNQSVIIPPYTTSNVNYVLSIEKVTISGQQVARLVWRQYYNESLSSVN